jgi:hypothetical protein
MRITFSVGTGMSRVGFGGGGDERSGFDALEEVGRGGFVGGRREDSVCVCGAEGEEVTLARISRRRPDAAWGDASTFWSTTNCKKLERSLPISVAAVFRSSEEKMLPSA